MFHFICYWCQRIDGPPERMDPGVTGNPVSDNISQEILAAEYPRRFCHCQEVLSLIIVTVVTCQEILLLIIIKSMLGYPNVCMETKLLEKFQKDSIGQEWWKMSIIFANLVINARDLAGTRQKKECYNYSIVYSLYKLLIYNIIYFFHRKFQKFTAELHPIPVKANVWRTIGVDLIGPLPETERGNKQYHDCLLSVFKMARG